MDWRDEGLTASHLEVEDKYGFVRVKATVRLVWDRWMAVRSNHDLIGMFDSEEEAKAVATVTVRMEQADGPQLLTPSPSRGTRRRGYR